MTAVETVGQRRADAFLRFLSGTMFGPLLVGPLKTHRLWVGLGWSDIVQSYRRTILGPFWITLNLVIFTTAITLVYGALFGMQPADYAGYVVCGMIAWLWVSGLLSEVGNTFIVFSAFLKSMPIDKSLLVWATTYKQLTTLAHQLPVYFGLMLFGIIKPSLYTLFAIPAIGIVFLMSIPITAITSILFARYRDLPRLIGGSVIIVLLTTPVFWQPTMLSGWRKAIVYFNPIYYVIEFIRRPMLGQPLDLVTVLVVLGMTALLWVVGARFYKRYEPYVVFWV